MTTRSATAVWHGDLKGGKGAVSTRSGVLRDAPYGFRSRFESGPGTNPEELLGAAHAGCYSMALALGLGSAGITAERIETRADVTLEQEADGFTITAVHLTCRARIPRIDMAVFEQIAEATRQHCPVSKVLNARVTLEARLDG